MLTIEQVSSADDGDAIKVPPASITTKPSKVLNKGAEGVRLSQNN